MARRCALVLVAVPLLLASCGGGVFIGYGSSRDCCDGLPSVSLAASPTAARPGDAIGLVAAASDDFGMDSVAFFRVDASGNAQLLGSDGVVPYTWDTTLPNTGQSSVSYFARAFDDLGQRSDSALVSVAVLP